MRSLCAKSNVFYCDGSDDESSEDWIKLCKYFSDNGKGGCSGRIMSMDNYRCYNREAIMDARREKP